MKKLEGIFGLKIDEYFDENKFSIISKEIYHGDYHISIDMPPKPNVLFKDYSISICFFQLYLFVYFFDPG